MGASCRKGLTALLASGLAMVSGAPGALAAHHHGAHERHARHAAHHRVVQRRAAPTYAPGYGPTVDPTPTCRYPDGTPFDPDIIGGANHVGDGGPAVNLGGFNPCGY